MDWAEEKPDVVAGTVWVEKAAEIVGVVATRAE
jgi:hypothetical protein